MMDIPTRYGYVTHTSTDMEVQCAHSTDVTSDDDIGSLVRDKKIIAVCPSWGGWHAPMPPFVLSGAVGEHTKQEG